MLTSKRKVSRYSLLRALASSNTICDSPSGAWALYMWFHLSILRRRFFSRWQDDFFFRAVWGLGTFSLDPFAVSFSRRQPSNEDVFTANVLYFCNLSFKRCYNESPLRCLFSLSWILYLLMCFLFQTMTANLLVCVCWCGASIEGICYWYISPRPINIFIWIVRRDECDTRQQELSEFYKEAENYCCKTKSWSSYVL